MLRYFTHAWTLKADCQLSTWSCLGANSHDGFNRLSSLSVIRGWARVNRTAGVASGQNVPSVFLGPTVGSMP